MAAPADPVSASGQARYRTTVASRLGVSRGTGGRWRTTCARGGLLALLDVDVPAGTAPALTPAQLALLQAVLDPPAGCASYGAVQRWLADEPGYHAVHKLVRYNLRANTVPREAKAWRTIKLSGAQRPQCCPCYAGHTRNVNEFLQCLPGGHPASFAAFCSTVPLLSVSW